MAATRIDCDIHPAVGGTRTTLLPYLDDHWKEQVVSRAIDGLDLNSYPPNMPLSGRADWRPASMGKPGSDLAMVQRGAFDQLGASHAICNVLYGAQAVFDPYMAAGFCKAINDWIAAEWLAKDPRLRASIVVPMQAPDLAVEEIERRAGDNRFVSVLVLAQGETLLGRRHFWPVWQAAEKHKLPIAIHAGSQYRGAPSSIGWPSYRYEYYLAEAQAFQAQILSLIYEGVFGKFPGPQGRADGIGRELAAGLHVARQQDLARRARRGALGRARAGRRSSATISASPCSRSTVRPMPQASPTSSSRSAPTRCSCSRPTIRTGSSTATIRCRRICRPASSRACAPTIRLKPFRG